MYKSIVKLRSKKWDDDYDRRTTSNDKNQHLVFLYLVSQYSSNLAETLEYLCQMLYLSTAGNRIKKSLPIRKL
uniref:Uncharacterized protein n=1 Tax=Romanomermis culicivorax TaxID=13658 RepID=A0A915JZU5_ROMCU